MECLYLTLCAHLGLLRKFLWGHMAYVSAHGHVSTSLDYFSQLNSSQFGWQLGVANTKFCKCSDGRCELISKAFCIKIILFV